MKTFAGLCLAALLSLPAAAVAQNSGDWVLSQWKGSSQFFPGVVQKREGNSVWVLFDDGTREVRPANLLRPFDWRAGSRMECRWTDGNWYPGRITFMGSDGLTLDVLYDDGDRQRTNTGRCRTPG